MLKCVLSVFEGFYAVFNVFWLVQRVIQVCGVY